MFIEQPSMGYKAAIQDENVVMACGRRDPIKAVIICDADALAWLHEHLPAKDGCTQAIGKVLFAAVETVG